MADPYLGKSTIDFSELANHGPMGEGLELLTEELARRHRLNPRPSGRGPDGGEDLLIEEDVPGVIARSRIQWLVSCKDYSGSSRYVPESDIPNIAAHCMRHDAQGFLLVTTTVLSAIAQRALEVYDVHGGRGGRFFTAAWNVGRLYGLLTDPRCHDIFREFLPHSYKAYMASGPLPAGSQLRPDGRVDGHSAFEVPSDHLEPRVLTDGGNDFSFDKSNRNAYQEAATAVATDPSLDSLMFYG